MKSTLLPAFVTFLTALAFTSAASAQFGPGGFAMGNPGAYPLHPAATTYAAPNAANYQSPYSSAHAPVYSPARGPAYAPARGPAYNSVQASSYGPAYGPTYQPAYAASMQTAPSPSDLAQPNPNPLPEPMYGQGQGQEQNPWQGYGYGYGPQADKGFDTCGSKCANPVQWSVFVDGLYMTRQPGPSYELITIPEPTHPLPGQLRGVALNTGDINYGYQPGYRVGIGRAVCDGWGLELAYWTINDGWDYDGRFQGGLVANGHGFQYGSDNDFNTNDPMDFRVNIDSEFHSGEVNITRGICDWATLRLGLRAIRFDEDLQVDERNTNVTKLIFVNTENKLFGGQIGGDFNLIQACCCRLKINATFNLGFLWNDIYHDPFSTVYGPTLISTANEMSLLGEAGIMAKYRLTNNCAFRAGYQFMGLNNVALAPDQLVSSDVNTAETYTKLSSLLLHGGFAGVEFFW